MILLSPARGPHHHRLGSDLPVHPGHCLADTAAGPERQPVRSSRHRHRSPRLHHLCTWIRQRLETVAEFTHSGEIHSKDLA